MTCGWTIQWKMTITNFHVFIYSIGDSQLSFEEYIKHSLDTTLQHDIFDYFDTNKDGTLQPAEYVETSFRDMDHNGSHCKVQI